MCYLSKTNNNNSTGSHITYISIKGQLLVDSRCLEILPHGEVNLEVAVAKPLSINVLGIKCEAITVKNKVKSFHISWSTDLHLCNKQTAQYTASFNTIDQDS